jgi:2-dehydropantoate 2-reductase
MRVGVFGAGAIGCYLGARLAGAGTDVVFVGREQRRGLTTIDIDGGRQVLERATVTTDPSALAGCDAVLVCVKSAQTAEAADTLARVVAPGTVLASMQNGVRNADVLRERAPGAAVLGGIVEFNVLSKGDGVFHQATSGRLVLEASDDPGAPALAENLGRAGFDVIVDPDVRAMQWSKLVMNLNNAVSALSDAPIRKILLTPGYRRCVAAIVSEALDVMRSAHVRTKRIGPLPVAVFPYALKLPTRLIQLVARAQLKIDPEARSSMWADLARHRKTEVDYLNGEIVRLARSIGAQAPVNERVVELVHQVEARASGSPKLTPAELWDAIRPQS